ncbi:hypothetical protein [Arthrobacter bambusae]|uniref:Uncharacterized protein n=1 Tax=Arthrobacter bambusae TaxID=1338426 RepID=A0AAW8DHN0_9MICC|nr:hypothetical protein [Arthrobacter bambusae]MDP9904779.1 hypothetical protein [Arthrobacter bambusae]MDQ0129595.1 hypothetical protein [Arthrobacter bambusae]MDQ0180792.1 hypothetical protein [Arthrobacter bambusae]
MTEDKAEFVHRSFRADAGTDTDAASEPAKNKRWNFQKPELKAPVEGSALEAKFDGWTMARREKKAARTPEMKSRSARRVIGAGLGCALAAMAVFTSLSTSAFDQQSAKNTAEIARLQAAAGQAQEQQSAKPIDPVAIAALTARASESATKVAEGQQAYASLYSAMNNAKSNGNGTPNAEALAAAGHRKDLAAAWDPASFVVDPKSAYVWTTTPYFSRDQIDPRFPWYVRFDGLKASDPKTYAWNVKSVMPKLDSPGTVRVVWACAQQDSTVLAWASATYNDKTGTFSQLDVVTTAKGAEHLSMTDAAKVELLPELTGTGKGKSR